MSLSHEIPGCASRVRPGRAALHLTRAASLAPSPHNSQPWLFVGEGHDHGFEVHAHGGRRLILTDPGGRAVHPSHPSSSTPVRAWAKAPQGGMAARLRNGAERGRSLSDVRDHCGRPASSARWKTSPHVGDGVGECSARMFSAWCSSLLSSRSRWLYCPPL